MFDLKKKQFKVKSLYFSKLFIYLFLSKRQFTQNYTIINFDVYKIEIPRISC